MEDEMEKSEGSSAEQDKKNVPSGHSGEAAKLSLGQVAVNREVFDLDLKINSGYQSYSKELLRLSLLAIAGISTVWLKLYLEGPGQNHILANHNCIGIGLLVALLFLAVSAASSVYYRYSAADSLAYHLTAMRRLARNRPSSNKSPSDVELAERNRKHRDILFLRCDRLLKVAMVTLLLGVGAFILTLWIVTA
jgi:hypothetical protein